MKISKDGCYAYTHLLWPCQPRNDQNRIVFSKRFRVTCTVSLLLLFTSAYIFWPSDPYLKIVRLKLKRIKVHRVPHITVDISMLLTLSVQNADVYSMDFGAVDVEVSYRGKPLGHVRSENGHVRAMGSSFVDADAEFAGIGVLPEIVFLLEDLAKGMVPFDTVSQVRGQMGILFFHFPIKAKLSCEVLVSTINQTIVRQHCLHEKSKSKVKKSQKMLVPLYIEPLVTMPISLRKFWRKIKRAKRKFFSSSSPPIVHAQYDLRSYSQNFDDGYFIDPDSFSLSFSSRFAVPSIIFYNNDNTNIM